MQKSGEGGREGQSAQRFRSVGRPQVSTVAGHPVTAPLETLAQNPEAPARASASDLPGASKETWPEGPLPDWGNGGPTRVGPPFAISEVTQSIAMCSPGVELAEAKASLRTEVHPLSRLPVRGAQSRFAHHCSSQQLTGTLPRHSAMPGLRTPFLPVPNATGTRDLD